MLVTPLSVTIGLILINKCRDFLKSAVDSLRVAERETCSKLFVRSAWTLADALYKRNEGIEALKIKMEAWQIIQDEGLIEEILVTGKDVSEEIGLEYWDEVYKCRAMDQWVVFSHS